MLKISIKVDLFKNLNDKSLFFGTKVIVIAFINGVNTLLEQN